MIIAEICQNHLGDKRLLKEMVHAAAESGASFAKIQTFFADDLSSEWKARDYDRLKSLELDWEVHAEFANWCAQYQILPMTSVYTFRHAGNLNDAGIKHIKIGSAQCGNEDLIRRYIVSGFQVYLSTGGREVEEVPRIGPLAGVFHCVSQYPARFDEINLMRMLELKRWFPAKIVGFSDHTDPTNTGNWDHASKLAMSMGAKFIERHFTILPRSQTKDGPVSVDRVQLEELCRFDRLAREEKILAMREYGFFVGQVSKDEKDLISKYQGRWME